jgi:hypothetical protein
MTVMTVITTLIVTVIVVNVSCSWTFSCWSSVTTRHHPVAAVIFVTFFSWILLLPLLHGCDYIIVPLLLMTLLCCKFRHAGVTCLVATRQCMWGGLRRLV